MAEDLAPMVLEEVGHIFVLCDDVALFVHHGSQCLCRTCRFESGEFAFLLVAFPHVELLFVRVRVLVLFDVVFLRLPLL